MTNKVLEEAIGGPKPRTILAAGGIPHLGKLIGFPQLPHRSVQSQAIRNTLRLRRELIDDVVSRFPKELSRNLVRGRKTQLLLDRAIPISVVICRMLRRLHNKPCWQLEPIGSRGDNVTILARLNSDNSVIRDLLVFPKISIKKQHNFGEQDPWLAEGRPAHTVNSMPNMLRSALPQDTMFVEGLA